jgi:hypothetical protein
MYTTCKYIYIRIHTRAFTRVCTIVLVRVRAHVYLRVFVCKRRRVHIFNIYKCTYCTYIILTCTIFVHILMGIDRQVRLVRLQTNNFRLFLRKQMDKQQTSICTMSKR